MAVFDYSTLLTGPSTYNGMGMFGGAPAASAVPAAAPSFSGFASSAGGAMSIAGSIASAIGSYYSAQAAKDNLKHQAKMAEINARVVELGRRSTLLQGQRQEQQVRLKGAQVKSAQRVGFSANGVDLNSQTVQNVFNTTDYITETDAITTQGNALAAAWGYKVQASNLQAQSTMATAGAKSISPIGSVASSLLGSASMVSDRWAAYSKVRG